MNAEVLRADDPVALPHLGNIGKLWSAVADVADGDETATPLELISAYDHADDPLLCHRICC